MEEETLNTPSPTREDLGMVVAVVEPSIDTGEVVATVETQIMVEEPSNEKPETPATITDGQGI